MKKQLLILVFALSMIITSCLISNPKPDECQIVTATISKISEGSTYDIVFQDNGGDRYYINRGIEQGLNLEDLNASVLNKSVTLHLPKLLGGTVISEHIAQLALEDDIIYTEFE